jgi:hypothetical protein
VKTESRLISFRRLFHLQCRDLFAFLGRRLDRPRYVNPAAGFARFD